MKQIIVLVSTIILGIFIYDLIAGSGDDSMVNIMSRMWQNGLSERDLYGQ